MKKDIFISYRRRGAEHLALLMYHQLQQDGYTVFLDVESLHNGKYDEALFRGIKDATDVLLILPPHALDTCNDPEDWIRQEVECALKHHKNIIPVMMDGFEDWPKDLPETMQDVVNYQGLTNYPGYFTQMMQRLEKDFLKSKPRMVPSFSSVKSDDPVSAIHRCANCGSDAIALSDPLPRDVMFLRAMRKATNWWIILAFLVFWIVMMIGSPEEANLILFGFDLNFIMDIPLMQMINFVPESIGHLIILVGCLLILGNEAYRYSETPVILKNENEWRTLTVTCRKCAARRTVAISAEDLDNRTPADMPTKCAIPIFLGGSAIAFSSLNSLQKINAINGPSDVFTVFFIMLVMLAAIVLHRIGKISRHLSGIPGRTFIDYLKLDLFSDTYDDEERADTGKTLREKVIRFAKPDEFNNKKEDE